jgi:hypothetical protein
VKPLEQTCSLLAVPKGLGKTSLIGQQIRSLGADRCLIITSGGVEAAEVTGAQLFARFALPFKVLDSTTAADGTNPIPDRPGKSLFVTTHDVFKYLLETGGWERFLPTREGPLWDLVAIEDIQRVINSENFESRWERENTIRSRTFTKHMVVLTTPQFLRQKEELEAISDLFDQRLSYVREASKPRADSVHSAEVLASHFGTVFAPNVDFGTNKSRLASRMVYIPTIEEQRIRVEEFRVLEMGNPQSDNASKFTCSPVGLRGPFEEKCFDGVMALKGVLGGSLPLNTVESITEYSRTLAAMNRRRSSASDERRNQPWASTPLASGIFGEGLFIRLKEDEVSEWESRSEVIERSAEIVRNAEGLMGSHDGLGPPMARMVLVHTFAHVIMNQWALDCGWPVSDFGERLYVGEGMAGVLIYTSGEYPASSLGRVIAQSSPEVVETSTSEALANAIWCSNDPYCISTPSGLGASNLGACHACAILPRTSCEAMNCFLDRGLLVQTQNAAGAGFFSPYISQVAGPSGV